MLIAEWKKNFAIMWSTQFIGMSAITGMISFLPLYVTVLGVSDANEVAMWSGILMGSASFCAALSNPYWGAMADRKGRKPMVEKVLFMYGIIIISMAYVSNVYQLLTLRILQGLCGGFIASATALVLSMTPPGEISFTVGMFQTSIIIGGATGPMIGGFVADYYGYRQPFIVFGGLCLLALAVIHFAVTENFTPVIESKKTSLKSTFQYIWSLGDLRLMLLVQFLTQFAIQSIGPVLPLYIRAIISDTTNLASISGIIIAVGGVTSAIASASMGSVSKRFSHKQILITASLMGAVSFIGQLAADDIISFAVLRAINGLCVGAMIPSSNTIITYLIPQSKRGAAYGITSGAGLMGNVLGPVFAGVLSLFFGISSIFWLTAILFLLVSVLLFVHAKDVYSACAEDAA
jgi:DHA1 family multidrug resistance protein-like MFS transporter